MQTALARKPFLVMNPRSGGGKVTRFGLAEKARQFGATVVLLDHPDCDIAELLRRAADDGADLLGVAGGDGTLGVAAAVAAERDVPLLVVPAGTRNHFAMDLGLDRAHPDAAVDALIDGEDVRVDLGIVGGRAFVNTVSFGAYAEIVKRPDYRGDKLLVTLDVLPQVVPAGKRDSFTVRTATVDVIDPLAALVSNNPYDRSDPVGLGRRQRLDGGTLGLICVPGRPPGPPPALARGRDTHPPVIFAAATTVVVEAAHPTLAAAIDGESIVLTMPAECRLLPRALRVRVPRSRPARRRPPFSHERAITLP